MQSNCEREKLQSLKADHSLIELRFSSCFSDVSLKFLFESYTKPNQTVDVLLTDLMGARSPARHLILFPLDNIAGQVEAGVP